MNIKNTCQSLRPFRDSPVQIFVGGRRSGDWRIYNHAEDSNPLMKLAALAASCDSTELLLPDVRPSNGLVVDADGLSELMPRISDLVSVRTGREADGVIVEEGASAALATGDCPTVVMWAEGQGFAVVAHAGRQSLIGSFSDMPGVGLMTGKRLDQSVIARMVACFIRRKCALASVHAFITLGIGGPSFSHSMSHPDFRGANGRMIGFVRTHYGKSCILDTREGTLSLHRVIKAQCALLGIPRKNVVSDGFDTATDREADDSFRWWSNRRGEKGRNLVFVSVMPS